MITDTNINGALTLKVAAMNREQRYARLKELAKASLTPETELEFAKLILGPDAEVIDGNGKVRDADV